MPGSTSRQILFVLGLAFTACAAARPVAATKPVPSSAVEVLGAPPLCEASAAVRAPWDASLVLVADNELEDRLFGFRATGAGGALALDRPIELPGAALHDLEALAAADGAVIALGSQGRNQACERKDKRRRFSVLRPARDGSLALVRHVDAAEALQRALGSEAACLQGLFVEPVPPLAPEVCAALVAAESRARAGACDAFNLEGAVGVPGEAGRERVWVGLRAPLVEGRAVLLRLAPGLEALRFDAVALLAGGGGIRELARDGDELLVITGPVLDEARPFSLVRAPLRALVSGATVQGTEMQARLPRASEGLVPVPGGVVVLVDGARGKKSATCKEPSAQLRVPRPMLATP